MQFHVALAKNARRQPVVALVASSDAAFVAFIPTSRRSLSRSRGASIDRG
jgi:hypothetical protein